MSRIIMQHLVDDDYNHISMFLRVLEVVLQTFVSHCGVPLIVTADPVHISRRLRGDGRDLVVEDWQAA
jgi:hypothetical protein